MTSKERMLTAIKKGIPEQTRDEVRRCFKEAGENGGYILCPSDHFF